MARKIELSDAVVRRLEVLGGNLFTPAEVIERLLDQRDARQQEPLTQQTESSSDWRSAPTKARVPRERGAEIDVNGDRLHVSSVPDMYKQVLEWLDSHDVLARLDPRIPFKTSEQRYLIAREPVHPNGNSFFKQVAHRGYYMEAHKNYENAMSGLQQFLGGAGIKIAYV